MIHILSMTPWHQETAIALYYSIKRAVDEDVKIFLMSENDPDDFQMTEYLPKGVVVRPDEDAEAFDADRIITTNLIWDEKYSDYLDNQQVVSIRHREGVLPYPGPEVNIWSLFQSYVYPEDVFHQIEYASVNGANPYCDNRKSMAVLGRMSPNRKNIDWRELEFWLHSDHKMRLLGKKEDDCAGSYIEKTLEGFQDICSSGLSWTKLIDYLRNDCKGVLLTSSYNYASIQWSSSIGFSLFAGIPLICPQDVINRHKVVHAFNLDRGYNLTLDQYELGMRRAREDFEIKREQNTELIQRWMNS